MTTLFTSNDSYWIACENEVRALLEVRPTTAQGVIDQLLAHDPMTPGTYSGAAFWSPAGGGVQLHSVLTQIGWHLDWIEADYHWQASYGTTGETITYCEGDVIPGPTPDIGRECDQCTAEAGEACRPWCTTEP